MSHTQRSSEELQSFPVLNAGHNNENRVFPPPTGMDRECEPRMGSALAREREPPGDLQVFQDELHGTLPPCSCRAEPPAEYMKNPPSRSPLNPPAIADRVPGA